MNPTRHEIVHEVIAPRNGIKDSPHHAGFIASVNPAKSKVGGVVLFVRRAGGVVCHIRVLNVACGNSVNGPASVPEQRVSVQG